MGKARICSAPNLGCRGRWITWVIWCFTKILCRRHDAWAGTLLWWSCQSPVVHSCRLLNHLNSFDKGMFKLNAKFDADLLLYSVILSTMATQYTCSLNGVYHLRWLVQWSCHCLRISIPVHSPWLPGYMNILQTVFIILIMAGLFPDRPCIYNYIVMIFI